MVNMRKIKHYFLPCIYFCCLVNKWYFKAKHNEYELTAENEDTNDKFRMKLYNMNKNIRANSINKIWKCLNTENQINMSDKSQNNHECIYWELAKLVDVNQIRQDKLKERRVRLRSYYLILIFEERI